MSYIDQVSIGGTDYDIQDTKAQADVSDLKSALNGTGAALSMSLSNSISWTRGGLSTSTGSEVNKDTVKLTRIRSDYRAISTGEKIAIYLGVYCLVFYYTDNAYLGYHSITNGELFNVKDFADTNYSTATQYKLLALLNPEATIGDGTDTDYSDVIEKILVLNDISENIEKLSDDLSEIDYDVTGLMAKTNIIISDMAADILWERGFIRTSGGNNSDTYTTSRIRSIDKINTGITIQKQSDTTIILYFYNAGTYVSYNVFNNSGIISISKWLKDNNVTADAVRIVALLNPEDTIGDGTGTDYSDVLSKIDFVNGKKYKPYTSGFTFFTVQVNTASPITSGDENEVKDSESIENVTCMIKLPTTYTQSGKPTKLLMICHGAGRGMVGDNNWTTQTGYNNIVNAFLTAGFAVFDCQGYADTENGRSFWGAKQGVQAWRKAYDYIIENYNVEHEFSIYGFSMGGLTALGLAFDAYPNIKAIALSSPVLDLTKCVSESTMRAAYGLNSATYDESACRGCNPMAHVFTFNSEDTVFSKLPPLKIWYGGNETNNSNQPYVEKTDATKFVTAVMNGGGYAIYREITGVGHEICYGLVPNAITEYVMFLKRY